MSGAGSCSADADSWSSQKGSPDLHSCVRGPHQHLALSVFAMVAMRVTSEVAYWSFVHPLS